MVQKVVSLDLATYPCRKRALARVAHDLIEVSL